ncbi:MAG: HNH endonuclease, partial [Dehalococcoidia bacterium]
MAKNPPWERDELILALELYFRHNPNHISQKQKHPEVVALSRVLNGLPIHADRSDAPTFRNPTGVYMKLANFLRLDPGYTGKGLTGGSKLDEVVWDD